MEEKKLVISIARSYGSGGLTLAKKLGKELAVIVKGVGSNLHGQITKKVNGVLGKLTTR